MSADLFRRAEDEFLRLKRELVTRRIDLAEFHNSLKQAKVKDSFGRYWTIGAKTGKWYFHDGATWVQADPYTTLQETMVATPVPMEPPAAVQVEITPGSATQPVAASPVPVDVAEASDTIPPLAISTPALPTPPALPSHELNAAPPFLGQTAAPLTASLQPRAPTSLYLLVMSLGLLAILCALIAVGVILAAGRGLIRG